MLGVVMAIAAIVLLAQTAIKIQRLHNENLSALAQSRGEQATPANLSR
jgi:hypothetical protein